MAQTRITAGEWRSRLIDTPPGMGTRPTSSRVREALFNILGQRVVGGRLLDLYGGAGTLSFEALSRGARAVTLVERDRQVLRLVAATAERLGCIDQMHVVPAEVVHWIRHNPTGDYDICFIDPPYRDDAVDAVLRQLGLQPPALVVCEHHRRRQLPQIVGLLRAVRTADYGQTSLTFFERETAST